MIAFSGVRKLVAHAGEKLGSLDGWRASTSRFFHSSSLFAAASWVVWRSWNSVLELVVGPLQRGVPYCWIWPNNLVERPQSKVEHFVLISRSAAESE